MMDNSQEAMKKLWDSLTEAAQKKTDLEGTCKELDALYNSTVQRIEHLNAKTILLKQERESLLYKTGILEHDKEKKISELQNEQSSNSKMRLTLEQMKKNLELHVKECNVEFKTYSDSIDQYERTFASFQDHKDTDEENEMDHQ